MVGKTPNNHGKTPTKNDPFGMEIGGTTILGNTHTYIYIYKHIYIYIYAIYKKEYNPSILQKPFTVLPSTRLSGHPPDIVSISSCPVDTGPLHLEKTLGARSVEEG